MTDLVVQASFNAGEWSPALYARVDLAKYRAGAALLENFFVDYRGGASTRPGSKYILQAKDSAHPVRLITFQAAFNVGYVLEFGQNYIRFYYQGAPVLETALNITGITRANPAVVTVANTFSVGDWVYITSVGGMAQVNGNYYTLSAVTGANVTLADLNGNPIDSSAYTAYTAGGTIARVYTIASPYLGSDLALVKFAQITNEMILCHPSYPPYQLTLITATNWTMTAITFGSTATTPSGVSVTTTLAAGNVNYSYVVTSIDSAGQESGASTPTSLASKADIRTTSGSNHVSWAPAPGAIGYNVYESYVSYFGVVPNGVNYGFIGTVKGTDFIDSNITPNFNQSVPVAQNPFVGNGIAYITITVLGAYTTVPTASTSGGSPSIPAVLVPSLGANVLPTITAGGAGFVVGDTVNFGNSLVMTVTTAAAGAITGWAFSLGGVISSGSTPANPIAQVSTSGAGTGAQATVTWGVTAVNVLNPGAGFNATPTIVFSAGAAAATATLAANTLGNPSVPGFCQQRLTLAAQSGAPQTFHMSQPGAYFNFDITAPVQADNAITETLVASAQENIKSIAATTAGMAVLTDKAIWMVSGATGAGSAISATSIVANRQSTIGASDVPPIVANYSILYVQAKGNAVRDTTYNIYYNTFTGTDITVLSSHLFFGYTIEEWAWAESPFYLVWAVRNDGVMLTLTFVKEQDFTSWTHHVTNGNYKSVCTVTETTQYAGNVDAVYTVVQRTIQGNSVQYIERMADRVFPTGAGSAWCVDAGVQYTGAAALTFTGAQHLAGELISCTCVDTLDRVTARFTTVNADGSFTLVAPSGSPGYVSVIAGLGFTCNLQTLAIDAGQVTIQGKVKHLPDVTVRVKDTIGLNIGADSSDLVPMKDLIIGNISSMATGLPSQRVTGLVTGDARTILNPTYNELGQFYIQQTYPYPATVLGVFPHLVMGDVDDRGNNPSG